jgi:hydroxyethylthiazole kinase-like uncharacterized protein yjeF
MQKLNSLHLLKKLKRHISENKSDSGNVVIIGGSVGMAGSIVLAGLGALLSGAGWVKLIPLNKKFPTFIPNYPELMVCSSLFHSPKDTLTLLNPDVVVIGPGLGQNETAREWLIAAIEYQGTLLIDADGISLLAKHPELKDLVSDRFGDTILTPHPGEASHLLHSTPAAIQHDRLSSLLQVVDMYNAIVILKGHKTLLGMKKESNLMCHDGNPGMACAGMGDVLSGLIGSLIAQGQKHHLTSWNACCLGVELHALAGDSLSNQGIGPIGMRPSELAHEVRNLINHKQ